MPFEPTPEELLKVAEGYFYWQGILTLLGCDMEQDSAKADIALVGLPWTSNGELGSGAPLADAATLEPVIYERQKMEMMKVLRSTKEDLLYTGWS